MATWTPNLVKWQSFMPVVKAEGSTDGGEGQTDPAAGQPSGQQNTPPASPPTGKTFSQEDVERIVKERLDRFSKKTAEDAENERLKAQQEFQKLAEKAQKRVSELEAHVPTLETELAAYRDHIAADMTAVMEKWPDELKALVPADGPLQARLTAFNAAKAVAAKLEGRQPAANPAPGTPQRQPRPADNEKTPAQAETERLRSSGRYGKL